MSPQLQGGTRLARRWERENRSECGDETEERRPKRESGKRGRDARASMAGTAARPTIKGLRGQSSKAENGVMQSSPLRGEGKKKIGGETNLEVGGSPSA
jgi:hypothetical protein